MKSTFGRLDKYKYLAARVREILFFAKEVVLSDLVPFWTSTRVPLIDFPRMRG